MILIVGVGGHGQVVADIFRAARAQGVSADMTAFVDDDPTRQQQVYAGSAVLGTLDRIRTIAHDRVVVAIGTMRRGRGCSCASRPKASGSRLRATRAPSSPRTSRSATAR